VSRPSSIY